MKRTFYALSLTVIATSPYLALADNGYTGIHPAQNSPLQFGAGAFFSDTEYKIRLDDDGEKGTEIGFDDLGLDGTDTVPFGFLRWRFSDRWRLEGNVFSTSASGSSRFSEDIRWGDLDFNAGAQIKASNDMDLVRLAVGYSFLRNDRAELGAGVGLHYIDWETKLSGSASIDGVPILSATETASVNGIAPNVAFFGNYALSKQWLVSGRVDWISATVGDISGSLTRIGIAILYQPFENLGFGAGYDYIDVDVGYKKNSHETELNGNVQGPQIFATWSF